MRPWRSAYQGGAVGTDQYTIAPRSNTAYTEVAARGNCSRWRRST